jgi:hypothetical protein
MDNDGTAINSGLDELSSLAAQAQALEDVERAKTGQQCSFIALVQGNSGMVIPDDPGYIEGVKMHDFVIPQKKLILGQSFEATPLGQFKLYAEMAKKERDNELPPTLGFWMPEDAENVPVQGYFDRPLPNGNVLRPVHWVFLYLHQYPEIEDAVLPFRSIGNTVYTNLAKLIKSESAICTELRFRVSKQAIRNESYRTTNYYPKFELAGRNFTYRNGAISPQQLPAETVKEILERSIQIQRDYAEMRMIGRKNTSALLKPPAPEPAVSLPNQPVRKFEDDELPPF